MSQKDKILALLQSKEWVNQQELNRIAFRYGARLHDLKKEGYVIKPEQIGKGQYLYTLLGKEQLCQEPPNPGNIYDTARKIRESKGTNYQINFN